MNLKTTLNRLIRVVLEEAENNPRFDSALRDALDPPAGKRPVAKDASADGIDLGEVKRGKNRRTPPVLDPVHIAEEGESALRASLEKLSLEQLRDVVAEYGMDPGRVVMKWAAPDRVIDRIVEMSLARAHKGNAFRKLPDEVTPTQRIETEPAGGDASPAGKDPEKI